MNVAAVRHAELLATFDDAGREIRDGSVLIEGDRISWVGPDSELPDELSRRRQTLTWEIDARHHVVLPGLVNTHHHFYQTLTRNLPAGQDAELFDWLVAHYPVWARMDREALIASSRLAAAELMLSGCTTAADHTYIWPNDTRVDDEIEAVLDMGLRFHCSRGSMSVGESLGGLPPDSVVEDEDAILADTRRVIETYHDEGDYAMTRIVVAPCSPFSVSQDLMRESADLARSYGVHLHTHLAETRAEDEYCSRTLGATPVEFAERVGWAGEDVWFAHMVHPREEEIARLGQYRCGAAHCPSSNMRLGSGIAPLARMDAAGMRVGLGVDGSASNDSSNMLGEVRQAMLLQRLGGDMAMSARRALWYATRGGAAVLGRGDIGRIAPGAAADLIGVRLDTLSMAGGAVHDPLAALLFCSNPVVSFSCINGARRVVDGELQGVDVGSLVRRHNRAATELIEG
jgi:cytosine/adenosine deaminase-related metal-dependent hydrolase